MFNDKPQDQPWLIYFFNKFFAWKPIAKIVAFIVGTPGE